ncbi:MAG: hypothetical protein ABI333_11660 [bacterium]
MEHVIKKFDRMGARLEVLRELTRGARREGLSIDVIEAGPRGDSFAIAVETDVELQVLDCQPRLRHLLLMAKRADSGALIGKYLCGHDERHWFVAGVGREATNVRTAVESLKPDAVRQEQKRVRPKRRNRRHNPAFVRQGEWFFLPAPDFDPGGRQVLSDEPLVRGQGKPHRAQHLVRYGGRQVYVTQRHPNGLSEAAYRRLLAQNPAARGWGWRVMVRDPQVYVKGAIRHPDHKTVMLQHWYRVLVNEEVFTQSVAFLD